MSNFYDSKLTITGTPDAIAAFKAKDTLTLLSDKDAYLEHFGVGTIQGGSTGRDVRSFVTREVACDKDSPTELAYSIATTRRSPEEWVQDASEAHPDLLFKFAYEETEDGMDTYYLELKAGKCLKSGESEKWLGVREDWDDFDGNSIYDEDYDFESTAEYFGYVSDPDQTALQEDGVIALREGRQAVATKKLKM